MNTMAGGVLLCGSLNFNVVACKRVILVYKKVPPRFELGLLDSESNVLTTRPWDPFLVKSIPMNYLLKRKTSNKC
jgi:hypothetical protein